MGQESNVMNHMNHRLNSRKKMKLTNFLTISSIYFICKKDANEKRSELQFAPVKFKSINLMLFYKRDYLFKKAAQLIAK